MKSNFHIKFKAALWLAIFLFSLLCQGQNAHAQFGLFDTVWTINGLAENHSMWKSPNDSLFIVWTFEQPGNIDRFRLYNTLTKEIIWDTNSLGLGYILKDNQSILSFDSSRIILRNLFSLDPISSVNYIRPNFSGCTEPWGGISEIDTSIYSSGYCGHTAIKGISYKVNYSTGQVKETSHILPYFAMTLSEDGQYVAGVYYSGGGGTNVPYNEVIEVRKISDYSVVFRKETKYCDWTPNFTPYQWVMEYKFKFSKDNKYLLLYIRGTFDVYNLDKKMKIFTQKPDTFLSGRRIISFTKNSKELFYLYYTSQSGSINNVEYILLNLENLKQKIYNFSTESEVLEGGDGGLLFDDKYILSETTRIYDRNYQNRKRYDMSLAKLNFDLNSIQEPDNPIQGTLYPNPTNNSITLTFYLKTPIQLNYSIYSETGQLIKLLLDEFTNPGLITKSLDVSDLPIGTYFLRITGERFSQTYKVIINR